METQKNPGLGVYRAIAKVSAELSKAGIGKDRQAKKETGAIMYNFRGIDDVFNALSPILSDNGLVILPKVISREVVERATRNGGALFFVTVQVQFDLVAAEDGSVHTVSTFGEAQDSGDKATNKALSAAYKYMALQVFCIPVEGREDADGDDTPETLPGGKKPAAQASDPRAREQAPEAPPVDPLDEKISETRAADIEIQVKDAGLDVGRLLNFYGVKTVADLTVRMADHADGQIKKAIEKKQRPKTDTAEQPAAPTPLSAAAEAAAKKGGKS